MADRSTRYSAKPHRYSLVAAAQIVNAPGLTRPVANAGKMLDWQERAWDYYDRVGEFRFGVSWASNALSRVNLTAAKPPEQVGNEPTGMDPNDETLNASQRRAIELVEMIAGGASGQGQLLGEFGEHLAVAGFGWLVAEPDKDDPSAVEYVDWRVYAQDGLRQVGQGDRRYFEVRTSNGASAEAWRRLHPNALVVETWRKHPRRPWEADAPVRGVLGVLEIIELLTAHLTASGRSRLAGAGLLAIPAEAEFPPPKPVDGVAPTDQDPFDNFVKELTLAMTTPIRDRDNASAVVPLPLAIPGEYIDKIQHLSFSTPFDDKLEALLDQNIKRLALGLDMPPEVLTGMAGVNHWTAWQVEETAITLHVEPPAEIVCNALTTGFLRLALEAEGLDPDAAMVWYDTSDLTTPPDKSTSAFQAWDRLQLSGAALRSHTGFTEDEAPDEEEFRQRVLLDAAKGAPTLAPKMLGAAGILDAEVAEAADDAAADETPAEAPVSDETSEQGPPDREDRPGAAAAAHDSALLMACDGIVARAMELAGKRLLSAIGRKSGGPQSVADHGLSADRLHTHYDPTIYADLDHLLDGSFTRVPVVAEYLGIDAEALMATLNAYCRGLLAAGKEHDLMRLASALGADTIMAV